MIKGRQHAVIQGGQDALARRVPAPFGGQVPFDLLRGEIREDAHHGKIAVLQGGIGGEAKATKRAEQAAVAQPNRDADMRADRQGGGDRQLQSGRQ